MGTEIRPEISDKSKYWIEKHRYYELKHFCLQYPIWKKAHDALDGLSKRPADLELFVKSGQVVGDPTARCGVAIEVPLAISVVSPSPIHALKMFLPGAAKSSRVPLLEKSERM